MKTKNKTLISMGFILLVVFFSFSVNKSIQVNSLGETITLHITDAYYGNFDNDSYEDDIKVIANLDANFQGYALLFLYLDVTLPTGTIYKFSFQETVQFTGPDKTIVITAFNTATVSGWYTCELTGLAVYQDMLLYSFSTYSFDPPTGIGNGDPEAIICIT